MYLENNIVKSTLFVYIKLIPVFESSVSAVSMPCGMVGDPKYGLKRVKACKTSKIFFGVLNTLNSIAQADYKGLVDLHKK